MAFVGVFVGTFERRSRVSAEGIPAGWQEVKVGQYCSCLTHVSFGQDFERMRMKRRRQVTVSMVSKSGVQTKEKEVEVETAEKSPEFIDNSLKTYLEEIRRFELLSHSEEIELAQKVSRLVSMEVTRERLKTSLDRMPTFSEWAEAVNISVDDLQTSVLEGTSAKQTLVTANLRLVHSLVNQCTRRHGEKLSFCKTQDLLQEGVFGLLRAAEKFDCDKGFRFSTYATYWVNSFLTRGLQTVDRPVKIPARIHELYYKMRKVHREYLRHYGESPTEEVLAEATGTTTAKLRFCIECMTKATLSTDISISSTRNQNGHCSLVDVLESETDLAEQFVDDMFKSDLDKILRRYLNPKERAALRLRYGLDDGGERTLTQIAKVLDVSPERTRQIILNAMEKLRKREVQLELEDYMPDLFKDFYVEEESTWE